MLKATLRGLYGVYAATAFVVVVLLVFCPLLIVTPTLALRRQIGRITVRAWLRACFVPLRVRGLEHLPTRFTFLVQHDAANWPYVGLIIRRIRVSFVNHAAPLQAAHATCGLIDRVKAGESPAIFPEGTFSQAAALKSFYDGAFFIAAQTGVPVVPAVMLGSRRFFGEEQKLPRWRSIDIELFAPIASSASDHDAARAVMLAHCGEADGLEKPTSAVRHRDRCSGR